MGGYTPGPWAPDCEFVFSSNPSAGTGDMVCLNPAMKGFEHSARNWEANARLIASAPDLLEALFALLPHVEHSDGCGDMDAYNNADVPTCGCGLDSARERANAAISRATGEGE